MRSRGTFPLLLLVALLCMSIPRLTSTQSLSKESTSKQSSSKESGSKQSSSKESSSKEIPSPPTTESTIQKGINYVEHLVKETVFPSNPNAYNELEAGVKPAGNPGTSIAVNDSPATTTGIVTKLENLLNPLAQALYLFIDSLLRAFENKSLPCLITSWIPLEGFCTPLVKSPISNQPIPDPSGPQPTR